jgi:acyl-CoA synthetase (AMP-forming)/AMP-acid ligase II
MLGSMMEAVAVPLPPDATDRELCRDLQRLPPRLLVAGGVDAERVRDVGAKLHIATVLVDELICPSLSDAEPFVEVPAVDPDCTAVILHTSGTTGLPKRAPRSHRALLVGSRAAVTRTGLTADDVLLLFAGLANISGLGNLLNAVLSGGSCIAASGLDPAAFPRWLEDLQPTWTFATPTHLRFILDTAPPGRDPVAGERSRLRLVRAGTQQLPPQTRIWAERSLRAPILDTYGMSEAHSIAASGPSAEERREGSVGKLLQISLRIRDECGVDLPVDVAGAIEVRGPTVMAGYLDDSEANAEAFTADGWFRTGDVGYLDEDGFLFLSGRAKEQINRGGEQIALAEIDRVLLDHSAVAEAAAFAVPDALLGEDVVAAVVLRPETTATARDMRRFLHDRLAPSRAPRRIWFVETLPRTPTGKPQRAVLSERFLAEEDWEAADAAIATRKA